MGFDSSQLTILRQMVRSTPGDSPHRRRRRGEGRGDDRESNSGETVGATWGGTMGGARGEAMRHNRDQANRVGHIGHHEHGSRGPAPLNSHTRPVSSSDSGRNTLRPRHPLRLNPPAPRYYGPPIPSYSPPPPPYSPPPIYGTSHEASSLLEHGRRSTPSRSGSDSLLFCNQHNTAIASHADADSRRQIAARRLSESYPPSYRSVDGTNSPFYTSREALLSPRTSHEGRSYSFRAPARRQTHRYSYGSPERPRTSSPRDSESVYSSY
ncbi:hypothetical protein BTUL_0193g00170 [Botrytis tulipae]|uniref:Uncharacterized protein n=1 Tax=Botrytis tulipae TaxID=87230 RepID=A0A4Z1E9C9_9HELO|nr:hypothetical protein BTUL_0193g00170 [Botrytis tulipae]